jgi:hypothetical protein
MVDPEFQAEGDLGRAASQAIANRPSDQGSVVRMSERPGMFQFVDREKTTAYARQAFVPMRSPHAWPHQPLGYVVVMVPCDLRHICDMADVVEKKQDRASGHSSASRTNMTFMASRRRMAAKASLAPPRAQRCVMRPRKCSGWRCSRAMAVGQSPTAAR